MIAAFVGHKTLGAPDVQIMAINPSIHRASVEFETSFGWGSACSMCKMWLILVPSWLAAAIDSTQAAFVAMHGMRAAFAFGSNNGQWPGMS